MKKVLTLIAAVALSATAIAQNWKLDGSHSKIRFTTKYLVISDVDGEFKSSKAPLPLRKPTGPTSRQR